MEFSKILFWLAFLLCLYVSVLGVAVSWQTGDASGLAYIIPAAVGELATATGFYYWKAKNENRIKLMQKHGLKVEKDDIER